MFFSHGLSEADIGKVMKCLDDVVANIISLFCLVFSINILSQIIYSIYGLKHFHVSSGAFRIV